VSAPARKLAATGFCCFGWLSSLSDALHLLAPYRHPCTDGDTLPYLASMIAGPATLAMAAGMLAIGAGLGVRVRWPAWLHLGTLAAAFTILPGYLVDTSFDDRFICVSNAFGGPSDFESAPWQRAFAPLHNAALACFGLFLLWYCWGGRTPQPLEEP
jgi:hypothetical protein